MLRLLKCYSVSTELFPLQKRPCLFSITRRNECIPPFLFHFALLCPKTKQKESEDEGSKEEKYGFALPTFKQFGHFSLTWTLKHTLDPS